MNAHFKDSQSSSPMSVRAQIEAFKLEQSSHSDRIAHAKMLFDTEGPTNEVVDRVREIAGSFGWFGEKLRDRTRCILANVYAERGDWIGAYRALGSVRGRGWPMVVQYGSTACLAALHELGYAAVPVIAECARLMPIGDRRMLELQQLLSDRSKTIAVVGNSPVQIGRGAGAEIDAHDIVIRFNNFSEDDRFTVDYGRKTTIWARSGGHIDVWRRPPGGFEFVLFSGADRRYHGAQAWDVLETERAGGRAAFVPTRIFVELVKALDRVPSAGLLILHWLRKIRGPLAAGGVSYYGFKLTDQNDGTNRHYFANPTQAKGRHDWDAEAAYLATVILG
ncbi:glycosyltransferase family 29 protein [Prosthecodimorpha staleyi]|uniref:Glycosyltransferase family 29 protein n=1 Tax=Prosthecodimorpha staleyi TaxID=2840188 RepID=A0A947DA02_9HYPH|nr:glycosyltransferase family 29 protein [Prosthecodimorpha staleyi]MBT9292556.1 glycosyltransferase family 29 protein [Prosthecodimorpha staleyi]